jgi:hypothetical protein
MSRAVTPQFAPGASSCKDRVVGSATGSAAGNGTLLLADISGYTAFLQAVGEAHAADMMSGAFVPEAYPLLTSLLDGIVGEIAPPFVLSKVEGDAVFAFGANDGPVLHGQPLVDRLSSCYDAFRAKLTAARELMTCTCDACFSIAGLELKFVLHQGAFVLQSIAGHTELLGPDVTAAHLLLKNRVANVIGRSGYALFTEAAAAHLDVPLERALPVEEQYEHYPTIRAFVLKLPDEASPQRMA